MHFVFEMHAPCFDVFEFLLIFRLKSPEFPDSPKIPSPISASSKLSSNLLISLLSHTLLTSTTNNDDDDVADGCLYKFSGGKVFHPDEDDNDAGSTHPMPLWPAHPP